MEKSEILEHRIKVAHRHCIYFLIRDEEIVYVGKSSNGGFDRIGNHLKYSDKDFDSFLIEPCSESDVLDLETEYIICLNPEYNRGISTNNQYAKPNKIRSIFKFWTNKSFHKFTEENGITPHGDGYYKITDFIKAGR